MHGQFGEERINRTAKAQATEGIIEPAALVSAMNDEVHRFVDEAEQSDDLTMLAIKYSKKNGS